MPLLFSPLERWRSASRCCTFSVLRGLCLVFLAAQRFLMMEYVPSRFVASVIGLLRIQAESRDEKVQVKVLQTLLLAITPKSFARGRAYATELVASGTVLAAVGICIRLFDVARAANSSLIHNTAFAALRQLVTLLFDHVQALCRNGQMITNTGQMITTNTTTTTTTSHHAANAGSGGGAGRDLDEKVSGLQLLSVFVYSCLCFCACSCAPCAVAESRRLFFAFAAALLPLCAFLLRLLRSGWRV